MPVFEGRSSRPTSGHLLAWLSLVVLGTVVRRGVSSTTAVFVAASSIGAKPAQNRPWSSPGLVNAPSSSQEPYNSVLQGPDHLPRATYNTAAPPWPLDDSSGVRTLQGVGVKYQRQQPTLSLPSNDRSTVKSLQVDGKKDHHQNSAPSGPSSDRSVVRGLHKVSKRPQQLQHQQPSSSWPSDDSSLVKSLQDVGGTPQDPHHRQPHSSDPPNQRLSRTFSTQELHSVMPSAPEEERQLVGYNPNTYSSSDASQVSFPHLGQPQTQPQKPVNVPNFIYPTSDASQVSFSQFDQPQAQEPLNVPNYIHPTSDASQVSFFQFDEPQEQPETQTQTPPFSIPNSLTRFMMHFGLNRPGTRNDLETLNLFATTTQPPSTPVDESVFPSGQPYVPAFHQDRTSTSPPVQDSVPSVQDLQTFTVPLAPLASSTGTFFPSCFTNAICTMGVALFIAFGASSILLLPFQSRRRRSIDEEVYPYEVMKEYVGVPRCPDVMTEPCR